MLSRNSRETKRWLERHTGAAARSRGPPALLPARTGSSDPASLTACSHQPREGGRTLPHHLRTQSVTFKFCKKSGQSAHILHTGSGGCRRRPVPDPRASVPPRHQAVPAGAQRTRTRARGSVTPRRRSFRTNSTRKGAREDGGGRGGPPRAGTFQGEARRWRGRVQGLRGSRGPGLQTVLPASPRVSGPEG